MSRQGGYVKEYETYDTATGEWVPSSSPKYYWTLKHTNTSTITDVGGPRSKVERVNPVTHYTRTEPMMDSQSFGPIVESSRTRYWVKYFGFTNQASGYITPRFWVTSLPHREAADQFNAEGVGQEVALPNFLLELPQSLNVIALLKTRIWNSKSVSAGIWDASKDASDKFIAYNFGVKPFIADLRGIAAYSESLQKRLEWLLENQGKTVTLDFRKTLFKPTATISSGPGYWWKVVEYSQTYHAFCRWTVKYDPVKAAYEKLRYFNRYFGTSKILSAAWEAIPFSFVIDWVSNLGDLLKQIELPSTLSPEMKVVGYAQKEYGKYEGYYAPPGHGKPVKLAELTTREYVRTPGLPLALTSVFDTSTLTGKQQALAFALIHQKMR